MTTYQEDEAARELRGRLATLTGTDAGDWQLTFKARYGMEVAFAGLAATEGEGEVVTQLLTCVTAVDPILAAGLRPVYGEISRSTLALDPALLPLTADTRAVVLQHTYGVVDQASSRALARKAHEAGALLVEDCAHCVGRLAAGEDGKPLADLAVFSFGVQKMLPTRFGGALWVNPRLAEGPHAVFARELAARCAGLRALDPRLDEAARGYLNRIRTVNHLPGAMGERLRARWIRSGKLEPAVAASEQRGELPLEPQRPSAWVCAQVVAALDGLEANLAGRVDVVGKVRAALADAPALALPAAVRAGDAQPLMRVPVLARDTATSDRMVADLRAKGVWAEHWGRPLLFPGVLDEGPYLLPATDALPVTREVSSRIVCLPTELGADQLSALLAYLAQVGGSQA